MKNKEGAGLSDRVIVVLRDKDGNVKVRYDSATKKHKCLTNGGFAQVAALILTDQPVDDFDFVGIGTGTTAADPTDTSLETLVKRKAGTGTLQTTTVANDTAQLVATFSKAADGLTPSHNITEVGVFTTLAAGIMLLRQVFTAIPCDWDAGDTLEMTCQAQCKQGA